MQFDTVLAVAAQLLDSIDPQQRRHELRDHLTATHAVRVVPDHPDPTEPALICVDGAVAHDQTDALVWIAAVGVNSTSTVNVPATMVLPVSPTVERARSMLMALCELAAALQTADTNHVAWVDGSLATPLISIATGLLVTDPVVADLVCTTLTDCGADALIADYVHYALQGRLRALPKQDTASGFCQVWAQQLGTAGDWLTTQSDRITATAILEPGEHLRPRPAVEALRVAAKTSADTPPAVRAWAQTIDEILDHWRHELHAYVTYVLPASAPMRAVKIEYTLPTDTPDIEAAADTLAATLAARAGDTMIGTRVLEPLPQHQADTLAKREVTALITQLVGAASTTFRDTHPAAVRHYRT
ncbi:hypothetical protein [Prescottella subtropica]|uniref:hypothetical protein n=1 Tax=Prescottella subtropica TaxID=2545757 RepID=UPI0010F55CCF|nr:hypothetical protein [Prescottella subtropica]